MKNMLFQLLIVFLFLSCEKNEAEIMTTNNDTFFIATHDDILEAPFGDVPYRVYYPENKTSTAYPIILSRGGNGQGDDRGALRSYAHHFVLEGYVVVQIDHRNAGINIENIAKLRGEEIQFLSQQLKEGNVNFGGFLGDVDGTKQGYIGHSAGAMEGLLSAGMNMRHGNYYSPGIKAVYAMSPPGYLPDQFGIVQHPNGFAAIDRTAVVMIVGEDEKDSNGPGTIVKENWRLQGYEQMNENELRMLILVNGRNTLHEDIAGLNRDIKLFNQHNAVALFDTYVKGLNRKNDIAKLALPSSNDLIIKTKGL